MFFLLKGGWVGVLRARLKQVENGNHVEGQSGRETSLCSLSLIVIGGLLGFLCAWLGPLLST